VPSSHINICVLLCRTKHTLTHTHTCTQINSTHTHTHTSIISHISSIIVKRNIRIGINIISNIGRTCILILIKRSLMRHRTATTGAFYPPHHKRRWLRHITNTNAHIAIINITSSLHTRAHTRTHTIRIKQHATHAHVTSRTHITRQYHTVTAHSGTIIPRFTAAASATSYTHITHHHTHTHAHNNTQAVIHTHRTGKPLEARFVRTINTAMVLHRWHTAAATLLLHCCYTVVTPLLHCCYTVGTLLASTVRAQGEWGSYYRQGGQRFITLVFTVVTLLFTMELHCCLHCCYTVVYTVTEHIVVNYCSHSCHSHTLATHT
jgi:hypothetical protein